MNCVGATEVATAVVVMEDDEDDDTVICAVIAVVVDCEVGTTVDVDDAAPLLVNAVAEVEIGADDDEEAIVDSAAAE